MICKYKAERQTNRGNLPLTDWVMNSVQDSSVSGRDVPTWALSCFLHRSVIGGSWHKEQSQNSSPSILIRDVNISSGILTCWSRTYIIILSILLYCKSGTENFNFTMISYSCLFSFSFCHLLLPAVLFSNIWKVGKKTTFSIILQVFTRRAALIWGLLTWRLHILAHIETRKKVNFFKLLSPEYKFYMICTAYKNIPLHSGFGRSIAWLSYDSIIAMALLSLIPPNLPLLRGELTFSCC